MAEINKTVIQNNIPYGSITILSNAGEDGEANNVHSSIYVLDRRIMENAFGARKIIKENNIIEEIIGVVK